MKKETAQKNKELLQNPRYWTKVLAFMMIFGGFVKYEIGVRDHDQVEKQ